MICFSEKSPSQWIKEGPGGYEIVLPGGMLQRIQDAIATLLICGEDGGVEIEVRDDAFTLLTNRDSDDRPQRAFIFPSPVNDRGVEYMRIGDKWIRQQSPIEAMLDSNNKAD